MQEQINKYARGIFEYEPPRIKSEEVSVYVVVYCNKDYEGVLHLYEESGKNIKGVVYSSDDRVILSERSFSKPANEIHFTVSPGSMMPGDVIDGNFTIVSSGGELIIPYSFRVEAGCFPSSIGDVKNLFHFANLAASAPEEAVGIFGSADFEDVFLGSDLSLRCIYEGLSKGEDERVNLEEFLIAVHKKSRINLNIKEKSRTYHDVYEVISDTIELESDTWGYAHIDVDTDVSFIECEKYRFDTDCFVANKYEFRYTIRPDKLHGGRNYGCISISTPLQKLTLNIVVDNSEQGLDDIVKARHEQMRCVVMMTELYIEFRSRMITVSKWVSDMKTVLAKYESTGAFDIHHKLVEAQVAIVDNDLVTAGAIIDDVKDSIKHESPDDYPLYCYFLYVNSLYSKDRAYSARVSTIIKECYEKNRDWRILWSLLFVDDEMENNKSLKLIRIKELYNRGCHSPIMYLEACLVLCELPQMLRVMNDFEHDVIMFGAEHRIIDNPVLCENACELITATRYDSDRYIPLLRTLYFSNCSDIILEALCKLAIRNNITSPEYMDIYLAGIEKGFKINKIFEFYLASRDKNDMSPLPKLVLMYFSYNNNLDSDMRAYLYANIISNKADNPQMFRSYMPDMERFVKEQIMVGRISDHLAIIYREIMDESFVNADNAALVAGVYFTYKITCNVSDFNKVIIRHKESSSQKEYAFTDNKAYVRIYTEDPAILFEDEGGNRYCSGINYSIARLFDDDRIVEACMRVNPDIVQLELYNNDKIIRYHRHNYENTGALIRILNTGDVSRNYRKIINGLVLDFYYDSYDEEGFKAYVRDLDIRNLDHKQLTQLMDMYVTHGEMKQAYDLCMTDSYMDMNPKRVLKMCSSLVFGDTVTGGKLLDMCYFAFSAGKYDDNTLDYLVRNYNRGTAEMLDIWNTAKEFGLDTYELEERIVGQMLFTHKDPNRILDVFTHYYAGGAKERIVEAYLAYDSYMYFVKDMGISEDVFNLMEAYFENGKDLTMVCKMALLRRYSYMDKLTSFRRNIGEKAINELVRKGYVFPFYLALADKMNIPIGICDKMMVEYHSNPGDNVVIHYFIGEGSKGSGKYLVENMKNVYEGIFVSQFVVFSGDKLQYYITVNPDSDSEIATEPKVLPAPARSEILTMGRYKMLNDMIINRQKHNDAELDKQMHVYAVNENVTRQLFVPKL